MTTKAPTMQLHDYQKTTLTSLGQENNSIDLLMQLDDTKY